MTKHYYIRGNAEHPEMVITALVKLGGKNTNLLFGDKPEYLYFIQSDDSIGNCLAAGVIGRTILTHPDWEELQCPMYDSFQRVLTKSDGTWRANLYSHYDGHLHVCVSGKYCEDEIIPYEGNERLIGTTENPDKQ